VQGVEGNGQSSNCGRTNKEGIGFIKAETAGYERYLALYRTPQSENGCSGCRFFLMCKGQCPGTSIDHDWRNRTEHCEEWKHLFNMIERRMILAGEVPLTIQPVRFEIERRMIEAWRLGKNPSINRTLSEWQKELTNTEPTQSTSSDIAQSPSTDLAQRSTASSAPGPRPGPPSNPRPRVRISWVSERAREIWSERLQRLIPFLEDMSVHAAGATPERCTVRLVPESSVPRLMELAQQYGLSAATLPQEALPSAIATRPEADSLTTFLSGSPRAVATVQTAWSEGNLPALMAAIDLPACCANRINDLRAHTLFHQYRGAIYLPESVTSHPLLAPLGISILPVAPCSLECAAAQAASDRWLAIAAVHGYADEIAWLRECLSWAVVWSELHGVTEIKTPVLKACFESGSSIRPLQIRRAGTAIVEGATTGLSFPYAAPPSHARLVTIGA
jgi:radical SAM protein with 4Fe4S-binding SPASM domain